MGYYNSDNAHILATHMQAGGNRRMLLSHITKNGRHEFVIGSYFTISERLADEGYKEYSWDWGHYFGDIVDAVDYWKQVLAGDR